MVMSYKGLHSQALFVIELNLTIWPRESSSVLIEGYLMKIEIIDNLVQRNTSSLPVCTFSSSCRRYLADICLIRFLVLKVKDLFFR